MSLYHALRWRDLCMAAVVGLAALSQGRSSARAEADPAPPKEPTIKQMASDPQLRGQLVRWKGRVQLVKKGSPFHLDVLVFSERDKAGNQDDYVGSLDLASAPDKPIGMGAEVEFEGTVARQITSGKDYKYGPEGSQKVQTTYYLTLTDGKILQIKPAAEATQKSPAKPAAAADAEKTARGKLNLAQQLLNAGNKDKALARLEEIVSKYRDTKAAEEAAALLAKLNAK